MKIFAILVGTLSLSLPFSACQKKPDPPAAPSKTEQLTASAWTYDNSGIDQNRDGTIDINLSAILPGAIPACRLDNSLRFKTDNTGLTDEGTSKCNTADLQQSSFSWSFADNETSLVVSNNVFALLNGKAKIVALTDKQLSLTRDTVLSGTTYPLVLVLKH